MKTKPNLENATPAMLRKNITLSSIKEQLHQGNHEQALIKSQARQERGI